MKFILFLIATAAALDHPHQVSANVNETENNKITHSKDGMKRIVGGKSTTIERFPWQLSLRKFSTHLCGASLIAPNRALTAGQCYYPLGEDLGEFTILAASTSRFGNTGAIIVGITKFISHPDYNYETDYNDIAVIWLQFDLQYGEKIRPTRLPTQDERVPYGSTALLSGWGSTRENNPKSQSIDLQYAATIVIDYDQCKSVYVEWLTDKMICAGVKNGGIDACTGDKGGALVVNGEQIGIVSWGVGCGQAKYPGVYTRVAAYRNWINSVSV